MSQITQLHQELVYLILQFCREEKLNGTAHMLERETAVFFDLKYFEDLVCSGEWDEVERYLSGFGRLEDNKFLLKVYFDVRKQKFYEALDMGNQAKALEVVRKEMKVFALHDPELYKEITQLLTYDDFRQHKLLSTYTDIYSARQSLSKELRKIIEADPSLRRKLDFPTIGMSRLKHLINQSLNWQHSICKYPKLNPDIKTLLKDHFCERQEQSGENNIQPLQRAATPANCSLSSDQHADSHTAALEPVYADCSEISAVTSDAIGDSPETEFEAALQEVHQPSQDLTPKCKLVDLPKTIGCVLNEKSSPTTMDFHPADDSVLLVGTDIGDVALWDIISRKKLFSRSFNVWDIGSCSLMFKTVFMKDPHVSVNRAAWSPDGQLIGVAYSKHIVQIYIYQGGNDVLPTLEIDAHAGSVNDIAFAKPDKDTVAITCGDDKIVKVWDAQTGASRYVLDDHRAAVTCVCPREIREVPFIFSTTATGEMRGWLYNNLGYRIGVDDPFCRPMICTKDGKRVFACGINEEEQPCILEWDDDARNMKKSYQGLKKPFPGVVHFDTAKNKILAAGDDHEVKFWDMSNFELLSSTNAEGLLPLYPYIRFSKEGMFLAVSAKENRVIILATPHGLELLKYHPKNLTDMFAELTTNSSITPAAVADTSADGVHVSTLCSEDGRLLEADCNVTIGKDNGDDEALHLTDIIKHPELYVRTLSADVKGGTICRLIYSNAGNSILALTSNGIHLVWKWPKSNTNSEGNKETVPKLWRPKRGARMTNVLGPDPDINQACFVLSKNDSYLISASGGEFSLFNLLTFKRLVTFMPAAPATAVAIYPKDNNIIAIGREDSTVVIYNVRLNEVKCRLEGHSRRITDLAFSTELDKLISIGADAKIVAWDSESWEQQQSTFLPNLRGARIQFHPDQHRILSIQDSVLAIYKAEELQCEKQWFIEMNGPRISHAAFSCDGTMIYACFHDLSVSVLDASNFQLITHITPSDYLPAEYTRLDISSMNVCSLSIASHPKKPYQFALGLEDGMVIVIEPREPHCDWVVKTGA